MPELPEVETSCRGIAPWVENEEIHSVIIRERRLRWPVSEEIELELPGKTVQSVQRRAKYIFICNNQRNGDPPSWYVRKRADYRLR